MPLAAAIMAAVRKGPVHAQVPANLRRPAGGFHFSRANTCLAAQPQSLDHAALAQWSPWSPTRPRPRRRYDHSQRRASRRQGGDPHRQCFQSHPPVYSPKANNTGAAVVVFPGGGYRILAIDLEGTEVCDWLNSVGITCVLVKYRVPEPGPYPKSSAPLQDAQRAFGMVRAHADEWHIDPNRIGVLGFSAGAHLAAALSTHFDQRLYDPIDASDKLSCRPDFAVIVYPGYLALASQNYAPNPEIHPTAQTPPTFIVQAEDDRVTLKTQWCPFMALKNAKVPAELHIYAQGGHGYGLRRTDLPVTTWPRSVEIWLHTIHVLPASD